MAKRLWEPSSMQVEQANMTRFIRYVNERLGLDLDGYDSLWEWSVNRPPEFWGALWDYFGVIHTGSCRQVVDDPQRMPGARWFEGLEMNFAENLLRFRDERTALVFKSEARVPESITSAELYRRVASAAAGLKNCGVVTGDRVAGFMPNMTETVVAMLSCAVDATQSNDRSLS